MTARLKAICSLIPRSASLIDVGCDHGYAVKYACDNMLADRITACDISAPSLEKARLLVGDDPRVTYECADGAVAAKGHDTVLVSGMGGDEICRIIAGCAPRSFVLSPQTHAERVRYALLSADYDIVYDKVVVSGGKYYDVIKATAGGGRARLAEADEIMLGYGMYSEEKNEALRDKLTAELAAVESYPATRENLRKKKNLREVLKWQLR